MKSSERQFGAHEPMHRWRGADGIELAVDSWGDPGSPPVVLLHGGGQTRHSWRATALRLATEGYYAVSFDARGHGDSGWSAQGDYDQDSFVRDLQCVVELIGSRRPVLLGASLGGNTSLAAAGSGAVDAAALILVDVVPRTEQGGFNRIKAFMTQKPDGFESLEEVADAISRYRPDGQRRRNLGNLAKNVRLGSDGRYRWHWDPRFLATREQDLAQRYVRLSACALRLQAPTLLVRGGSSDVVSDDGVNEFLALCPHAEYVNVLDAGHMVTGVSNDIFGRATLNFLARHAPVSGCYE